MTATIETEELRGKITHNQYTLVLEDLFIGLTKSSPECLSYLPALFKQPLEKLKVNYFSAFGTQSGLPSPAESQGQNAPLMSAYLDSQQTPDKGGINYTPTGQH